MKLSILIPALNEEANLATLLPLLQPARKAGHQIVVCDGGSTDRTSEIAAPLADLLLSAPRGRALQMNAAARHATGEVLLFLHADTRPPAGFAQAICDAIRVTGRHWGRFDVHLETERTLLKVVQGMMNLRSRWTSIATGDQALFVTRELFHRAGGFPEIALMEDIEISKTLKRFGPPLCLRNKVVTSASRWEQRGVYRTIFAMWRLRLAYWSGADPAKLAALYYGRRP
ncbi:MAG: glycosyltransferase [Betaproteobacteria bacterium]|nr:glycosyltransferase [Betaproteobacteria bacterium]